MCKFKSAIVTKSGEVYHHDLTDSHAEIQTLYNLVDRGDGIACVEFVPMGDWDELEKYELRLDSQRTPEWWDAVKSRVEEKLKAIVAQYIKTGDVPLLLGTRAIIRDGLIREARHCIVTLYGSSKATLWDFSKATLYSSSKATLYSSSKATLYGSSKATLYGSSKATLYDSSKATLHDSSMITDRR